MNVISRATGLACKRVVDVIFSSLLLIVLAPLLASIAICIMLDSGLPVFFTQERVGLRGRLFRVCKFRTMVRNAEQLGLGVHTGASDPRITRIGAWLRQWSLDELPQLLNILRGEMSIVGPRPTLPYQVERYTERQRMRLLLRPGVTGWAQVNGRNSLTWPQRIELDVWYVEHWSLWLDLRILFRTFAVVCSGDGVYGQAPDEISRTD